MFVLHTIAVVWIVNCSNLNSRDSVLFFLPDVRFKVSLSLWIHIQGRNGGIWTLLKSWLYDLNNRSFVGNQKTEVRMDNGLKVLFPFFPDNIDGNFWSLFLSKVMGYAIILGSVIMKVPQIYQIWRNRSVLGLNVHSFYFECAENLPFVVYNLVRVLYVYSCVICRAIRFLRLAKAWWSWFKPSSKSSYSISRVGAEAWCIAILLTWMWMGKCCFVIFLYSFWLLSSSCLSPQKFTRFPLLLPLVSNSCSHH